MSFVLIIKTSKKKNFEITIDKKWLETAMIVNLIVKYFNKGILYCSIGSMGYCTRCIHDLLKSFTSMIKRATSIPLENIHPW